MSATVAPLGDGELAPVAAFVARRQQDPTQHVVLTGTEPDVVAAELQDLERWRERLLVARGPDGAVVGAVLVELDADRRRTWWWGPWSSDPDVAAALLLAGDELLAGRASLEEFAPDARNVDVAALATARGCVPGTPSAVLSLDPLRAPAPSGRTRSAEAADVGGVAALHDAVFPGTHTTGAALVAAEGTVVRVATPDGEVAGYVAVEVQHDGTGYVDFLGVAPAQRGAGLGRALVGDALVELAARGVPAAHLTVHVDNTAARALYASLGFVEERVVVPFRRGEDAG